MKSVKKRFCISLLCLFGILWGLSMMLSVYTPEYITPQWHYLLLLFVVVSVIMYRKTINMRDKNDIYKLTNFHMIATILKLVGYLAIIAIYVIKKHLDSRWKIQMFHTICQKLFCKCSFFDLFYVF